MTQKGITVYCASSSDIDEAYFVAARQLGRLIAGTGLTLIDGAGSEGLMGAINDACLDAGGRVNGVIPQFMIDRGWNHRGLTELTITPDMHSRKQIMADNARAAIALPGGCGTFEELLEIITWKQLGLFNGNVVILNTMGYYDPLIAMLDKASAEGFMRRGEKRLWYVAATPEEAIETALNDSY